MTELESDSGLQMCLLVRSEGVVEKLRLIKVLLELGAPYTLLDASNLFFVPAKRTTFMSKKTAPTPCITYSTYPPSVARAGRTALFRLGK